MKRIAVLLLTMLLLTGCGAAETAETVSSGIDYDLTTQSATVIYAQVYAMMTEPEKFLGKTVKMQGEYAAFLDENTGAVYYACMISDAAACCSQGFEFLPPAGWQIPELASTISVTGTFETYEENGATYCRLRDTAVEVLPG